jgi:hypothetical protein
LCEHGNEPYKNVLNSGTCSSGGNCDYDHDYGGNNNNKSIVVVIEKMRVKEI